MITSKSNLIEGIGVQLESTSRAMQLRQIVPADPEVPVLLANLKE